MTNGLYFTRKDIFEDASRLNKDFKESQLQRYINNLIESEEIIRIGRNQYSYVYHRVLR